MGFEYQKRILCGKYTVQSLQIHTLCEHGTLGVTPCGHVNVNIVVLALDAVYELTGACGFISVHIPDACLFIGIQDPVAGIAQFQAL